MPPKSNNEGPNPKKITNYKESITYRSIKWDVDQRDFRSAFETMQSLSKNPMMDKKHANMMDILVQAYEGGDHSDALVAKLNETVEDFFKEMADKGGIHQQKLTIDPFDQPSSEDPNNN